MVSKWHTPQDTKELDINKLSTFFKLYNIWQEVDADLEYAGLGMPSTFADHISRVNSNSPTVVAAEKAWFEALIKSTHLLTEHQFEILDPNLMPNGSLYIPSQATAPRNEIFPTYFMQVDQPAIPRLQPFRFGALPYSFDVPNGPGLGYTKEQLGHGIRMIASTSPYDTFHGSSGQECIRKLHPNRPGWTVAQVCPDLVPGIICGGCDAEGLVAANFIMARNGHTGQAQRSTIPPAVLKITTRAFLKCPVPTPFEHFIWFFAANTYATEKDINGCEIRSWKVLKEQRGFRNMVSWVPTTPTKAAFKQEQERLFKEMKEVKPQVKTEVKTEVKAEKRKRDA